MGKNNHPKSSGGGQQQPNTQSDRGHAHAPYNFVPLNDQILRGERVDHDQYFADKHTGYFDVTLETKTPLFVRGMMTEADMRNGSDKTDMPFMLNGKPVIPGSSLRGMIRTIVEIITFGKMHFVDDANKIFFRAVAAEKDDLLKTAYEEIMGELNSRTHAGKKVRAGYLRKKGDLWSIQPAQNFGGDSFTIVKQKYITKVDGFRKFNDSEYQVQSFDVCYKELNGKRGKYIGDVWSPSSSEIATATLVCTGNMKETNESGESPRTYLALVRKPLPGKLLQIPDTVIEDYKKGISAFQKDNERNPYFDKESGFLQEGRVVFYVPDGNDKVKCFGHTPNFRVAHLNNENRATSPRDFVPNELLDPYFTDYADAMFGYVSDKGFEPKDDRPVAYSGRLSFTNASLADGQTDFTPKKEIIRILGAPKPTTFQHYLEQPEDAIKSKANLLHYGNAKRIRGYKLYWRRHVNMKTRIDDKVRDNVDIHMKPLREGLTFAFRVYFENLTNAELGALAWALSLDDAPDGNRHHMLGMAKPYGLGVVKLAPTLHLSDRQARYRTLFDANGAWYKIETQADYAGYINAFMVELERNDIRFTKTKRIRELLAMLTHMADSQDRAFQYMTIEPVNEYKDRPVLPRPREVTGD